jgi:hypothetical protein
MLEIIQQILGPAGVVLVIATIVLISGIKILKNTNAPSSFAWDGWSGRAARGSLTSFP